MQQSRTAQSVLTVCARGFGCDGKWPRLVLWGLSGEKWNALIFQPGLECTRSVLLGCLRPPSSFDCDCAALLQALVRLQMSVGKMSVRRGSESAQILQSKPNELRAFDCPPSGFGIVLGDWLKAMGRVGLSTCAECG